MYNNNEIKVLQKYTILDRDGKHRTTELISRDDCDSIVCDLMSEDAAKKLIDADKTKDQSLLDWIFYLAAGGKTGEDNREKVVQQQYQRFVFERQAGYIDPDTNKEFPAMTEEAAKDLWVKTEEAGLRADLAIGDEDIVRVHQAFGFSSAWPGINDIYQKVVASVTKYQQLQPKLKIMNEELAAAGKKQVNSSILLLKTEADVNNFNKKIERYFMSKIAAKDIRFEMVNGKPYLYDDDYLTAIVPLTWCAATQVGHASWPWANKDKFNSYIDAENTSASDYDNEWLNITTHSVPVIIQFKNPTPAWISRVDNKFELNSLQTIALFFTDKTARSENVKVSTSDASQHLSLSDIYKLILDEPARIDVADEYPVSRGANVYTVDEAEKVIEHLKAAVSAIDQWFKNFDMSKVKKNCMTIDSDKV
jgi:hypothetical protein